MSFKTFGYLKNTCSNERIYSLFCYKILMQRKINVTCLVMILSLHSNKYNNCWNYPYDKIETFFYFQNRMKFVVVLKIFIKINQIRHTNNLYICVEIHHSWTRFNFLITIKNCEPFLYALVPQFTIIFLCDIFILKIS